MPRMQLLLAIRNLLRHRTRTGIAIGAVTFGVIALLLAGGFIQWIFWALREGTIQTGLGHVHIVRPGYYESGIADPFAYTLPAAGSELALIASAPGVKSIAPRLNFGGLVSHADSTVAFVGEGVDPPAEAIASKILPIASGEDLSSDDPSGALLGAGLAANLGVRPGDKLVLLTSTASGGVNAVDAHVRGIFASGFKARDDSSLRVPIPLARTLLKVAGSHVWVVTLNDTDDTRAAVDNLTAVTDRRHLQIVPWYDLADFYNKTVNLLSGQLTVMQAIVALIILLSISNLQIMNVLERTGEIGTVLALGTRSGQVLRQFALEGLLLGCIGAALGAAVGAALAFGLSAVGIPMPPPPGRTTGYSGEIRLTWQLVVTICSVAIGATALASVYPAWRGSRLQIVDALRHNR